MLKFLSGGETPSRKDQYLKALAQGAGNYDARMGAYENNQFYWDDENAKENRYNPNMGSFAKENTSKQELRHALQRPEGRETFLKMYDMGLVDVDNQGTLKYNAGTKDKPKWEFMGKISEILDIPEISSKDLSGLEAIDAPNAGGFIRNSQYQAPEADTFREKHGYRRINLHSKERKEVLEKLYGRGSQTSRNEDSNKIKNAQMRNRMYQDGGTMTAPQEAPMAEGQEEGGNPLEQILQMAMQAVQNNDANAAMQVCQALVQMVQQPEQPATPQFKKGGKLTYGKGGKTEKGDLNKDGKMSSYEEKRRKAVSLATGKKK